MHDDFLEFAEPLQLESGSSVSNLKLAYRTYGKLNADKSNVVWVCHALTANANPDEWWPGLVGQGKLFDPSKHFIVCANLLGSPYGTSFDLQGNNYSIPTITIRDNVHAFAKLRKHLGITRINTLIGGSIGGHQALEWAIIEPNIIEYLILIATSAKLSPWAAAFNETQRLAIEASGKDTESGLKVARAIALLSYRNSEIYNKTQSDDFEFNKERLAQTYQAYQGEKLVKRFDARSYQTITKTMDSHDVGRERSGTSNALKKVKAKTLVVAIDSDLLFQVEESQYLANSISNASFANISSEFGHDGFLVESKAITHVIENFYKHDSKGSVEHVINSVYENISLFGLGCVGSGFHKLLSESSSDTNIDSVIVKNSNKVRNVSERTIDFTQWQQHKRLSSIVVECINDDQEALDIARETLSEGKSLVSASKKMIAENLSQLVELEKSNEASFLYEAAVAASIPILRLLNDYHEIETVQSIRGILNGSSNYILCSMEFEDKTYQAALDTAISKGFAESDPTSDVGGYDAKYKAIILALHGFGLLSSPDELLNLGIQNIDKIDISFANENNWRIKQVASIVKNKGNLIGAFVLPEFITTNDPLYDIHYENNAIQLEDKNQPFLYKGKGAGDIATGMAVLSDLQSINHGYKYDYKVNDSLSLDYTQVIKLYIRRVKNTPWPDWNEQVIIRDLGEVRYIEIPLGYLLESQQDLSNGFFVARFKENDV